MRESTLLGKLINSLPKVVAVTVLSAALLIVVGETVRAQSDSIPARGSSWCRTEEFWLADRMMAPHGATDAAACAPEGPCDGAAMRDSYIPGPSDPITYFRVFFHILRNDDGSGAACTPADLANAMDTMNADYLPYRIQFEYSWKYDNSTNFRVITSRNEGESMKANLAVKPDSQMNVYVVYSNTDVINGQTVTYSYGNFPWDVDALLSTGGIVMARVMFAPYDFGTLTHETGHCLGLLHTQAGVSEATQCGSCYESPGASNRDAVWDWCSDTDPTPTNYSCGGPGGTDPCSGQLWGPTDPQNYMGYAPSSCYSEFSAQQSGRMHCWTNTELQSWMYGVTFTAANAFGPVPITVSFAGSTPRTATGWLWDFGDGGTSTDQNPTHEYIAPGYYTVTCTAQTTDGPFSTQKDGAVSAYMDTLITSHVQATPGQHVQISITADNHLPLTGLMLPFTFAGPLNMTLDSVSDAGLRTSGYAKVLSGLDVGNKRYTYTYDFTTGPGGALPPGSGPVLKFFLKVPSSAPKGVTNEVKVTSFSGFFPTHWTHAGEYLPTLVDGYVITCRPGDVDNNGIGPDISDLTYLVSFLFLNGPTPPNEASANVDGVGSLDIGDLTVLIAYMFLGGSLLTCG